MNFSRKSIALYVGLVFVSGAVLGVFGDRLYTVTTVASKGKNAPKSVPSPEEFRRGYLGFMQKRLSLTDPQVTQLGLILDETRARMNEVHERTVPEQQEIQKSQSDKIRALLTPAQQSEYDVVIKERRERMKKGGPRGGPGGF
jgi:Spy/CpxP family protein refolding chaperone